VQMKRAKNVNLQVVELKRAAVWFRRCTRRPSSRTPAEQPAVSSQLAVVFARCVCHFLYCACSTVEMLVYSLSSAPHSAQPAVSHKTNLYDV
jgi:hypothetical protein